MRAASPAAATSALQTAGERLMLGGDAAGDDRRPVGELRQQRDHARRRTGRCPSGGGRGRSSRWRAGRRQAGRRKVVVRARRGVKFVEIDAVHDHGVRHLEETAGRGLGGDDRIHAPDQPFGERLVMALCGRGEDQLERRPQHVAQQHAGNHFDVAAGMPDAERPAGGRLQQAEQLAASRSSARPAGRPGPSVAMPSVCAWSGTSWTMVLVTPDSRRLKFGATTSTAATSTPAPLAGAASGRGEGRRRHPIRSNSTSTIS